MSTSVSHERESGLRTIRVEALSDGVFAIVMTLLVLELRVPDHAAAPTAAALAGELQHLGPRILAYVMTFVILGVYWAGHHNQFHFIRKTDRTLVWINVLFLLTVALIPFTSALVSEHGRYQISVVLYGANLIATGMVLYLHWWYAAARGRLVHADTSPRLVGLAARRILLGPVVALFAVALSFVNTALSITVFVLLPLLYILPGQIDHFWGHSAGQRPAAVQPLPQRRDAA